MPQEKIRLTDPDNPKNQIDITVIDGEYPTDQEIRAMFDQAFPKGAQPKPAAPASPVKPATPPAAIKPIAKPQATAVPAPLPLDIFKTRTTPNLPVSGVDISMPLSSLTQETARALPPVRPSGAEQMLRKKPMSELTAMTPTERTRFQASITPAERTQLDVNQYIYKWLSGKRPESLAFQKFVDYANAANDAERKRALSGVSEVGQAAFKKRLLELQTERDISMSPVLGLVVPGILQTSMPGQLGSAAAGVYDVVGDVFGAKKTPLNIAGGMITSARVGATALTNASRSRLSMDTEGMAGTLPLGFDPRGAMLPVAGEGVVTSPGQYLRSEISQLLNPESLALMIGAASVLRLAGGAVAKMAPSAQRAAKVAFALANVPGMVGAIQQGDPAVIATSGLLAFAPDILGVALPKGRQWRAARALQAEIRKKTEAYDAANPGARQRMAVEAAQEGVDMVEPTAPLKAPDKEAGELFNETLDRVSSQSSTEASARAANLASGMSPEEATLAAYYETYSPTRNIDYTEAAAGAPSPAATPEVQTTPAATGAPSAPTTPAAPGGAGTKPGELSIGGQTQITNEMAALFGNPTVDAVRLTPEQRETNFAYWKRQAAEAIADYENIFNDVILPDIDNPTALGVDGRIRVAAAMKQAELLTRLLNDPTNVAAPEWLETSQKLGQIVVQAGSRAGLELAMTRWFTLSDIDWSAPDIATKIASTVQRLGITDPETLVSVARTAESIGRRQTNMNNAQDAAAALAEAVVKAQASRPKSRKTQASRVAARAAQTVRDLGPTEDDYNAALQRLRSSMGRTNTGVDPTNFVDMAVIGTYKLKNGLASFIEWSDSMVADLGETVRPYLQRVWDDIRYRSDYAFDTPRVNVFTMFSGGGVFEMGIINKGVNLVGAVEYDTQIAKQYAKVHGDHVINDDVRNVDYRKFRDRVDHLHASPVCKAFSSTPGSPTECAMDMEMASATARAIREIFPKSVSIENVEGYVDSKSFKIILDELKDLGYRVDVQVYNAADFGTPQKRKRMLARAWRVDEDFPEVLRTHGPGRPAPWVSWDEATEDLIPTLGPSKVPNWIMRRFGIEDVSQLPFEGTSLMEGKTFSKAQAPRILPTGRPANTILASPETFRVLNETEEGVTIQAVTPRGVARMMGLPDSYPLPTAKNGRTLIGLSKKVIGNGVTPQMAAGVVGPMITRLSQLKAEAGAGRLAEVGRSGPTQADFIAAMDRVRKAFTAVGITPMSTSQQLPEDLIIVGWYIFKTAADSAGRKFAGWSDAVRGALPDVGDARMQELWLNVKYRDALARGRKAVDPLVFVDELGKLLRGRANAVAFLDLVRDQDGTPTLVEKWINGEKLTPEEQKRSNDAWEQVFPRKKVPTPEEIAEREAKPIGQFRKGRDELRALERELERQRKDAQSRTLDAVRKKVDDRLDALRQLPSGLTGQRSRRVDMDAARYRENANLLTAHIRAATKRYTGLLDPDEVSGVVSKVIDDFKGNFTDLEGAKAAITDGLRNLKPSTTMRADFEAELVRRVGKERATQILEQTPDDILAKIAEGKTLTDRERNLVGNIYEMTRPMAKAPKPKTPAASAVSTLAEAGAEARRLAREALVAQRGDFVNLLRRKYGVTRAEGILGMIAGTPIQEKVDNGISLDEDDLKALAEAINKNPAVQREPDTRLPGRAEQVIMIAQERARGDADLRRASEGQMTASGIDKRSFVPIAVQEYRNGARSLRNFRDGIQKKYPGLFSDDELDEMFTEAAKAYSADYKTLDAQKAQIAKLVKARLLAEKTTLERFLHGVLQYNNIFRGLALGADFGILMTQGGFATLSRPGLLYSGLPSSSPMSKLNVVEQYVTGTRANRKSASTLSAMLQAWGSEKKVGEFEGEIDALQQLNYGSDTFYKDAGLVLETIGGYDSALSRAETYTGLESLESIRGIGDIYKRSPIGKPMYDRFERATAVGINRLRVSLFENMMMRYKDLPPLQRDAAARLIAEQVNLMTGRAPLSPQSRLAVAKAAWLLTAPEFYISRAAMSSGVAPIGIAGWRIARDPDFEGLSNYQKANLASTMGKEYARAFVSYTAMKTMMKAAGYEVDEDPRSPEFGSAKVPSLVGGYRPLDMTGGLGPWFALYMQMVLGETKDLGKQRAGFPTSYKPVSRGDKLSTFAMGKASALPQQTIMLAFPVPGQISEKFNHRQTSADILKNWATAERRTPGGTVFTFKQPGDAVAAMFSSNFPSGIFLRSFVDTLLSMSNAAVDKKQAGRVLADWAVSATASSFGIPVGRPRIKPELRPIVNNIRKSRFRTEIEKQRKETELIYKGVLK